MNLNEKVYYGPFTQKALENFQVSGLTLPEDFIKIYIQLKMVYAKVNRDAGKLEKEKASAILKACEKLLEADPLSFNSFFPIENVQGGGGTTTNMMINEVIANIAEEMLAGNVNEFKKIHPNDHVNMSQSSNDTFPAVVKIMACFQVGDLIEQLNLLKDAFGAKSSEYAKLDKVGRTHLQDALKISFGDEFSAWSRTIEKNISHLSYLQGLTLELPLGATALGSMQNITEDIRDRVIEAVSEQFGIEFSKPANYFEATSSSADLNKIASGLANLATDLIKVCNDLRLLGSGPRAGLGELKIPEVQPGSSIMPGKINPSIIEAMEMICFEVIGGAKTVEIATMHAQLQLQQFNPVIAWSLNYSLIILVNGIKMLTEKCIRGIEVNKTGIAENLENSFIYATDYSERLGYDKIAELVKKAYEENLNLRELLENEATKAD